jgi:hypothetical protein
VKYSGVQKPSLYFTPLKRAIKHPTAVPTWVRCGGVRYSEALHPTGPHTLEKGYSGAIALLRPTARCRISATFILEKIVLNHPDSNISGGEK